MKTNILLTLFVTGFVVLAVSANAYACCGHCTQGTGHPHSTMWNNNGLGSKFNKETLSLRKKARNIELKIEQEYTKESPDIDVVTELKKELVTIHGKIEKIAIKLNLPSNHESWCWMDHSRYW